VFFQAMLLAGYLYAHLITTTLRIRTQVALHGLVLVLPLACLPIAVVEAPMAAVSPIPSLVGLLTVGVGLPFFVISTTAPLLQSWYVRLANCNMKDPYFLYAASNIGSLGILVAYPLVWSQHSRCVRKAYCGRAAIGLRAPRSDLRHRRLAVGKSDDIWVIDLAPSDVRPSPYPLACIGAH
jgi:hypothetical protein